MLWYLYTSDSQFGCLVIKLMYLKMYMCYTLVQSEVCIYVQDQQLYCGLMLL